MLPRGLRQAGLPSYRACSHTSASTPAKGVNGGGVGFEIIIHLSDIQSTYVFDFIIYAQIYAHMVWIWPCVTGRSGIVCRKNKGAKVSHLSGNAFPVDLLKKEKVSLFLLDEFAALGYPILCGRTIYYREPYYAGMWYEWP